MRRKIVGFLMVMVLGLFFLSPIAFAGSDSETIKVGLLFPVTGSLAYLATESMHGVEMSIMDLNEQGGLWGKKIKPVYGDAVDNKAAKSEAERLITVEKVKLIMGTYSSSRCYVASEVAEKHKVIYWDSGCVADDITERGFKYFFRVNPNASLLGKKTLEYCVPLLERLGISPDETRIAIVGEDSLYGTTMNEAVKRTALKLGMKVVLCESYNAFKITDMTPMIMKLKAAKPDILLATCYPTDAVLLTRQSQDLDFNVKIFSGTGSGHNSADFVKGVGVEAANGLVCGGAEGEICNSEYFKGRKEFNEKYEKVFGHYPGTPLCWENYIGTQGLWEVLKKAGSVDSEDVRKAAMEIDIPIGSAMSNWGLKFDEKHQNQRSDYYLNQWQNGEYVLIAPNEGRTPGRRLILPYSTWEEKAKGIVHYMD